MDWTYIIDHNRAALLRLVGALFVAVGLVPGRRSVDTLSRHVHLKVLRVLRPAESTLRRLIIIMEWLSARKGGAVRLRTASTGPKKPIVRAEDDAKIPVFPLIDPHKRFDRPEPRRRGPEPRIFFFDGSDPVIEPIPEPSVPSPDDPVDAARLCGRLQSLHRALGDLPGQAKRLTRLMARRALAPPGPKRTPPMRPGWPPGYVRRHAHEIDELLRSCHGLALQAHGPPDTS